jgi:predicted small integral membrane protein
MALRLSKIVMCLSLAAFAFLVTFGNITDYGSNYAFVQHVLSMDTTFPGNALMYRAISSPFLWNLAYWLIILGEGITCILFLIASWRLWSVRNGSAAAFNAAKSGVAVAATMGFLVWFLGFMVIGGEWFAMWQSQTWNGQDAAFKFYVTILAVLIFVNQPDHELP